MKFIIDRLKEASTYRGLALILAACGIYVDPALAEQIGAGIVAGIGIYDSFRKG